MWVRLAWLKVLCANINFSLITYAADQTPTPTRLIKNCEEVGLFEDLQNVNPFEETFRRACEQNVQHTPLSQQHEDSLHTPQVFPQFDAAVEGGICAGEDLSKQTLDTPVVLCEHVAVDNLLNEQTPPLSKSLPEIVNNKYRPIAPYTAQNISQVAFMPSTVQFVQPQLITVTFPTNANNILLNQSTIAAEKPTTKAKPLLLPKLNTSSVAKTDTLSTLNSGSSTNAAHHPEGPSSASMTPTSQLPIKERLKAILNQSSKSAKPTEWLQDEKSNNSKLFKKCQQSGKSANFKQSKDDPRERRKAASSRYRSKIRNEHKDLKMRNQELISENEKLKQRIKQLETEVCRLQSSALQPTISKFGFAF